MPYKILDQNGLNFLTFTIVDWIDLFTRARYADIVLDSLRFCQKDKGLKVHAYVIMPSHLHLILSTDNPLGISAIIQSFKSFTAKQILKSIKDKGLPESRREWLLHHFTFHANRTKSHSQFQLWKKGNHPIILYSSAVIWQKLNYIHQNPVKAGIVNLAEHYRYSSAADYLDGKGGLLEVQLLDF